jgi:hypothetical protein
MDVKMGYYFERTRIYISASGVHSDAGLETLDCCFGIGGFFREQELQNSDYRVFGGMSVKYNPK